MPAPKHPNSGAAECVKAVLLFLEDHPLERTPSKSLRRNLDDEAYHKWGYILGHMDEPTTNALFELAKQAVAESWRPFPSRTSIHALTLDERKARGLTNRKTKAEDVGRDHSDIGDIVYGKTLEITGITEKEHAAFVEKCGDIVAHENGTFSFTFEGVKKSF